MKLNALLHPAPVLVEIGPDWLRARRGHDRVELPLERGPEGRLTGTGKAQAIAALKHFLQPKSWQPRARAWCAISSRGVSLRRLSLPGGNPEEFHQRLLLQIEAEFPLAPAELAWSCQSLNAPPPANGAAAKQELLVAAVKKEWVADYDEILRACGADPVFILAALARRQLCSPPAGSFALLDIGASQSELTIFENALPAASRIIFWEGKNIANPDATALDALAQGIKGGQDRLAGAKLFVSGNGITKDFTERLTRSLGNGCQCERLEAAAADGQSAAIAGLEKFAAPGAAPALIIRLDPAAGNGGAARFGTLDWKKWGARAGALVAAALLLPYGEALLLKPHLERKVAAFKTEAKRLEVIDRELEFLRNLKLSQPPYLDVLYVFAKAVPPGTRFDSLSLNSHGEVSLRAAFHDGQQVADFRNQIIASGFFTNVVVEEQVPTPDRQKVNVRMSAQEKPAPQLQFASAKLDQEDKPDAAKTGPTMTPPTAKPSSSSASSSSSSPPGPPMPMPVRKESP